ncbi:hypothetical protein COTS27_00301 [Spirochaetota bacterium]|nr:hypothetical protein COTS27_00301 [Spirochaetota bacterium]
MNILVVGNRLLGDALDALHAIHSLVVHYEHLRKTSGIPVRYSFLGYRYSYFVHEMVMNELGLKFDHVYYLENYLKVASTSKKTSKTPSKTQNKKWLYLQQSNALTRFVQKCKAVGFTLFSNNKEKIAQKDKKSKDYVSKHYPRVNLSWKALKSLIGELRANRYDLAVIMPGGIIFAIVTFLARIKVRVGHRSDGRSILLTKSIPIYKTSANFQNWANILNLLTPQPPFKPYIPKQRRFMWEEFACDHPLKRALCGNSIDPMLHSDTPSALDQQSSLHSDMSSAFDQQSSLRSDMSSAFDQQSSLRSDMSSASDQQSSLRSDTPSALDQQSSTPPANQHWKRYYAVGSQASESWRMWSGTHFYQLAAYLEQHHQLHALWLGIDAEYESVEKLRRGLGINLCGNLTWHNLLALLNEVRFLITNDTGVAHIGTLLCQTFIIFGPSNPIMASPYVHNNQLTKILPANCSIPFERRKEKRYRKALNIQQISPKAVITAIERKLNLH